MSVLLCHEDIFFNNGKHSSNGVRCFKLLGDVSAYITQIRWDSQLNALVDIFSIAQRSLWGTDLHFTTVRTSEVFPDSPLTNNSSVVSSLDLNY